MKHTDDITDEDAINYSYDLGVMMNKFCERHDLCESCALAYALKAIAATIIQTDETRDKGNKLVKNIIDDVIETYGVERKGMH